MFMYHAKRTKERKKRDSATSISTLGSNMSARSGYSAHSRSYHSQRSLNNNSGQRSPFTVGVYAMDAALSEGMNMLCIYIHIYTYLCRKRLKVRMAQCLRILLLRNNADNRSRNSKKSWWKHCEYACHHKLYETNVLCLLLLPRVLNIQCMCGSNIYSESFTMIISSFMFF